MISSARNKNNGFSFMFLVSLRTLIYVYMLIILPTDFFFFGPGNFLFQFLSIIVEYA